MIELNPISLTYPGQRCHCPGSGQKPVPGNIYARIMNPTQDVLAQRVPALNL